MKKIDFTKPLKIKCPLNFSAKYIYTLNTTSRYRHVIVFDNPIFDESPIVVNDYGESRDGYMICNSVKILRLKDLHIGEKFKFVNSSIIHTKSATRRTLEVGFETGYITNNFFTLARDEDLLREVIRIDDKH